MGGTPGVGSKAKAGGIGIAGLLIVLMVPIRVWIWHNREHQQTSEEQKTAAAVDAALARLNTIDTSARPMFNRPLINKIVEMSKRNGPGAFAALPGSWAATVTVTLDNGDEVSRTLTLAFDGQGRYTVVGATPLSEALPAEADLFARAEGAGTITLEEVNGTFRLIPDDAPEGDRGFNLSVLEHTPGRIVMTRWLRDIKDLQSVGVRSETITLTRLDASETTAP